MLQVANAYPSYPLHRPHNRGRRYASPYYPSEPVPVDALPAMHPPWPSTVVSTVKYQEREKKNSEASARWGGAGEGA